MRTLISAFALILLPCAAWSAFDTSEFAWRCPVAPAPDDGYVALSLSDEILGGAQPSLADLRLLDARGELTPFLIRRERVDDFDRVVWREVKLIDATFLPEQHARVTLDFDGPVFKNEIKVVLSETNYRRRVLIEGSADGQAWEIVAEDEWLIDVSFPGHCFDRDILEFPKNDFRYLRLTVFNMADDPRKIEVRSVRACLHEVVSAPGLVPVSVKKLTGPIQDKDHAYAALDIDLGYWNLPVSKVALGIPDGYFYRGFELYGRNELTRTSSRRIEGGEEKVEVEAPWQQITSGVLYRLQEDGKLRERVAIENLYAPYRYLQLRLFNADNPPLIVQTTGVARRQINLIYRNVPGAAYELVGGNSKAQAPNFDLARTQPGLLDAACPTVQPGALAMLDHPKDLAPWTERHTALIWCALIIAVLLMGVLIVKNLIPRSRTPAPSP